MKLEHFEIEPRGPFALSSAARFIAGWPPAARDPQAMASDEVRLGFLVDDWSGHAGVLLRQREDGTVAATITDGTTADPHRVRDQVARIVSLDHDGAGYGALGESDDVVGDLQRRSGWLRPVLFHSPFEAACWAVISTRMRQTMAARVRDRLCTEHGQRLTVEGQALLGFPAPERLLSVDEVQGLSEEKLRRLHGIARSALEGRLDRERLLALDHEDALAQLRQLPGIGRFWSQGIMLRAVGPTDAITLDEPRMRAKAADLYRAPDVIEGDEALLALAERWRPFRTWVTVLLRAAG